MHALGNKYKEKRLQGMSFKKKQSMMECNWVHLLVVSIILKVHLLVVSIILQHIFDVVYMII